MRRTGRLWMRGVLALAVIAIVAWGWVNRSRFTPVDTGSNAPDFALARLGDGDTVRLDEYRGRVVLLNFWATWCVPCRREMPSLERLYHELHAEGLDVLGLSVDAAPGKVDALGRLGGDVGAFVGEYRLTFPILLDPAGNVRERYAVHGLPTTFLIDREGRVRRRIVGAAEWDDDAHVALVRDLLRS